MPPQSSTGRLAKPAARTNEPQPAQPAEAARVLLFGGTTEGRLLAEWTSAHGGFQIVSSALTEYGGSLVADLPHVESLTGALPLDRMRQLMFDRRFSCIVDATHPYAAHVSKSIAQAAQETGTPLLRVVREGEAEGPWTAVASPQEAAAHLAAGTDRVLLTTGSKDLHVFAHTIPDFAERLFVRILPVADSLKIAHDLGIPASHIVAMQGPFSEELNGALLREFEIGTLVTKASGDAGGFWEKVRAAQSCGVEIVVIRRPEAARGEAGLGLAEAKRELLRFATQGEGARPSAKEDPS